MAVSGVDLQNGWSGNISLRESIRVCQAVRTANEEDFEQGYACWFQGTAGAEAVKVVRCGGFTKQQGSD